MVAVENPSTSAALATSSSKSTLEGAEDDDEVDETTFIDSVKVACLLCKRKFDSMDVLHKHMAMSDLHKVFCFIIILQVLL